MLCDFLILLACHSFFASAFPQLFQPASGPAGVTPYLNSSTVTSKSTSSEIASISPESTSTSISTSETSVLSTNALGTSPPKTSPIGTAPLGTAPLGTGVASSCPTSCSYDGPLISGYQWVPIVGNQTITATVVIQVVSLTANVSGPYGTGGSSLSTVGTETLYNSLPANVNIPLVNEFGSALGSVTTTGTDGVIVGTYLAYPTNALDYASTFAWSGALPAASGGSSSCASTAAPQTATLASHPAYAAASSLPIDVDGTNYAMVPAEFVDVAFLRSAFPDEEQFSACAPPILASSPTAVTGAVYVTVTSTANATSRPWQTNAPMIEHTVTSDDEGLGNFSPFAAHTEETVPIDDNTSRGSSFAKARTEATVPAMGASKPTSSAGGSSGGSGGSQSGSGASGSSSNSGSDSGLAGAIASAVGAGASPGSGAGSSGPQATALPENSGSSSGSSSNNAGTSGGSSSSGSSSSGSSSGGASSSGQGSSGGSSSGGSSSGSSGGSGSSGQGSSAGTSGGSSSGSNAGSGSSGSGASSSGGSTGGSSSGSNSGNAGSGSSSGSGSNGSTNTGGQSGSGSSSSGGTGGGSGSGGSTNNGAQAGSGANGATPPQSITVGSTTLPVIHTTVPVTSNVGGTPVTSNVPAVVIGGSTATLGQTLTLDNTPIAFTAAPTPGSSSGAGFGSGSSNSGSSPGSSGSGSSGSGSSSNSGSGSLGSGDQLIIGGTSTVPLGPIATGSSGSNAPAPITVGSQIIAPTSLAGGSGIGFVVGGQTLAPGHPITLGSGSQTTVVSLTTNSAGDTLLIQGTQTQTLEPGLSPITLGPQTIQPTSLPGGGEGFVIGSQTLSLGHPITLGTGSQTTVLSLTTDSAGDTLLVSGTSTKTLAGPGSSGLAAITLGTQVIQPTELPNGGEGFIISGQTLALGHPITLGTGSHTTVLSLTTDSAGDTILVSGTSTRTLAGPHSTGTGGYISGGLGGGNNSNTPEQSNDAGRLMIGTQNGKGLLALSMAMVMGIAGTIVIL